MPKFQPSFSLWPTPRFRGDEYSGFFSWIGRQQHLPNLAGGRAQADTVKQMVEDHHDRHARTVGRAT